MKKKFTKLRLFWLLLIAFFVPSVSRASIKKDIPSRVNKIRKTLQEKMRNGDAIEITGDQFHDNNLDEWVNWGNWGNWNNWNNWANWSNWGNWRNF